MKPIQLHLSLTLDEAALEGIAELIRVGVENGNKGIFVALADAIKELSGQREIIVTQNPQPVAPTVPPSSPEVQCDLIDANEVARMLGMSPRTVWRLRDGGRLPQPVSIGSLVRWRRTEIDDWIAAGCPPIVRWKRGRRQ